MIHPHAIVASLELVRRAHKPRLYKGHGVWLCTGMKGDGSLVTMWAHTPAKAYWAWFSVERKNP